MRCRFVGSTQDPERAILAGTMPTLELSIAELAYLAKMNGENIFVMETMEKKSKGVFPDLRLAERIQAKFALLLPEGLADQFPEKRVVRSANPRGGSRELPDQARRGGKGPR
jgi:hypothetical protein